MMERYRAKPTYVEARQVQTDEIILQTDGRGEYAGYKNAWRGDWVIRQGKSLWVWPDNWFRGAYEVADEVATPTGTKQP